MLLVKRDVSRLFMFCDRGQLQEVAVCGWRCFAIADPLRWEVFLGGRYLVGGALEWVIKPINRTISDTASSFSSLRVLSVSPTTCE